MQHEIYRKKNPACYSCAVLALDGTDPLIILSQTHGQQHALLGMLVLDRNNSYDVVAVEHVVIVLALRQCAIVRQSTSSEIPILCMALQ